MAWTVTLTAMLTELRNRGGYRRSTALTDAILTPFLNAGIAEVHELIVKHNPDFIVKSSDLATVAGNPSIALPSDFYKLRTHPRLVAGGQETSLRSYSLDEETMLADDSLWGVGTKYRYLLQAGNLRLVPVPGAVETIRIWYLPHATKLVSGGDTYDGVNGHEDLVYVHALRLAAMRDRRTTVDFDAQIQRLEKRLLSALEARNQSEPDYLPDLGRAQLS